jgi:hypothetical protein
VLKFLSLSKTLAGFLGEQKTDTPCKSDTIYASCRFSAVQMYAFGRECRFRVCIPHDHIAEHCVHRDESIQGRCVTVTWIHRSFFFFFFFLTQMKARLHCKTPSLQEEKIQPTPPRRPGRRAQPQDQTQGRKRKRKTKQDNNSQIQAHRAINLARALHTQKLISIKSASLFIYVG